MKLNLFLIGIGFVGLGACSNEPTSPEPFVDPTLRWAELSKACTSDDVAVSLSDDRKASTPPRTAFLNEDDKSADVARAIPGGWGGPAFFRNGVYYMYLVEPNQRDAAVAALISRGIAVSGTQFLKGRWDFGQLYDWYRYLGPNALQSVLWSSSHIDEAENRLEYTVINETERSKLESFLSSLDVPCYLVAIGIMDYPTLGKELRY